MLILKLITILILRYTNMYNSLENKKKDWLLKYFVDYLKLQFKIIFKKAFFRQYTQI